MHSVTLKIAKLLGCFKTILVSHMADKGLSNIWTIICHFPRLVRRKLEWKRSCLDQKQCPDVGC